MGKIKRKGAYEYNIQWHQDSSALIVAKAAEAALLHGTDIREFMMSHKDDYDFMCRVKVPRSNKLVMRWPEYDNAQVELATIIRYFVSTTGGSLVKIAPPTGELGTWKRKTKITDEFYNGVIRELLDDVDNMGSIGSTYLVSDMDTAGIPHDERIHTKNRSKHGVREMGVCVGWRVTDCSNVANFDRSMLNIDYYVEQTEKLVKPLLTNVSK